jgi:hypothetical protein
VLLVFSLEGLLHYLYVLLLLLMVDDGMLRKLKLRLIIERLGVTVLQELI